MADGPRMFGSYEHALDAKGRVILPARLRVHFTQPGFLTPHLEGCLALWRTDDFEAEVANRQAAADINTVERNRVRDWAAMVFEADIDRQGRMLVPPNLRAYAELDLETPVLVVGMINRVEIWSSERWATKVTSPAAGDS